ncbi:hypothetical protein F4805DRAFT_478258 [Annulohypoxylon moriforme]|nr:hypothetical protein F4805DRAFT_478258 [Annulohypoxylon moriforme]
MAARRGRELQERLASLERVTVAYTEPENEDRDAINSIKDKVTQSCAAANKLQSDLEDRNRKLRADIRKLEESTDDLVTSQGRLKTEKFLGWIDKYRGPIFAHALMLTTAEAGNVERFYNLSAAHKEALIALVSRSTSKSMEEEVRRKGDDLLRVQEDLDNSRLEVNRLEDQLARREREVARFIATNSGSSHVNNAAWIPFSCAVLRGDIAVEMRSPVFRPWSILRPWREDETQRRPRESAPASVADMTGQLYELALGGRCNDESFYLLDVLIRRLAEDDAAPIHAVLLMLSQFFDAGSKRSEVDAQIFLFSLWQTASLIAARWPSTGDAVAAEQAFESFFVTVPSLDRLRRLLRALEIEAGASNALAIASPDNLISAEMLLSALPEAPRWVVAFDLKNRSIRLISRTRGRLGCNRRPHCEIIAPEGDPDILMPIRDGGSEIAFFERNFISKLSIVDELRVL